MLKKLRLDISVKGLVKSSILLSFVSRIFSLFTLFLKRDFHWVGLLEIISNTGDLTLSFGPLDLTLNVTLIF
jgi:hypothetical protein